MSDPNPTATPTGLREKATEVFKGLKAKVAVTKGEALSPEILRKIGKIKSPKKREKKGSEEVVASPLGRIKLPNSCPQISLAQISALPVRLWGKREKT